MANFANNFWEIISVGIFGAIGLIIIYQLGKTEAESAGLTWNATAGEWYQYNGSENILNYSVIPASTNWSGLFGSQIVGNVSIVGVGVILVIIGGVMGYLKFIRK
jgi:hypothetical protein